MNEPQHATVFESNKSNMKIVTNQSVALGGLFLTGTGILLLEFLLLSPSSLRHESGSGVTSVRGGDAVALLNENSFSSSTSSRMSRSLLNR